MTLLTLESIPALQDEVRALAAERGAVILAHNYQLPEVQDVADFVGDSLGLSQEAAPDVEFIPANRAAFCRFMKMITLPKLRDALRDGRPEVKVPPEIARRARIPIERMVSIG